MSRLKKNFFRQSTIKVAKELLGTFLIRKIGSQKLVGKIVETEGYIGPNDLASHASRGKTPRTKIMFGPAGRAYIYLIYGMYYCLNIITEKENFPAAVLIRAVEPISGTKLMAKNRNVFLNFKKPRSPVVELRFTTRRSHESCSWRQQDCRLREFDQINKELSKLTSGPGKLCQAFSIDKSLNGENICTSKKLYIEKSKSIKKSQIITTKRIGVDYAKEFKDKKWRFYIKDNYFVSKK